MTRFERRLKRKELFNQSKFCCWCGNEMFLEPKNRKDLATLEHHYLEGEIVLAHHGCNKRDLYNG